jgi:DNA-directed RNA polymerase subunit RPC12/RpoP
MAGIIYQENRKHISDRRCFFALCEDCLWCATVFGARLNEQHKAGYACPNCQRTVELIPLADGEACRIE